MLSIIVLLFNPIENILIEEKIYTYCYFVRVWIIINGNTEYWNKDFNNITWGPELLLILFLLVECFIYQLLHFVFCITQFKILKNILSNKIQVISKYSLICLCISNSLIDVFEAMQCIQIKCLAL